MTRRWIWALALLCLWPSAVEAQTPRYEALTVSSNAVGISPNTLTGMDYCVVELETADIRFRSDGTNPSSTVGTPLAAGRGLRFSNLSAARAARFIRSTATDGVLHVNCYAQSNAVEVTGAPPAAISAEITDLDVTSNSANIATETTADRIASAVEGELDINVTAVNGAVPLDASSDATLQSAATATGNGSTLTTDGYAYAVFTVNCSVACSGGTTIHLEGTEDGTNYDELQARRIDTGELGSAILNQGTTITIWRANVSGLQAIRARISAYSAGTITVTARAVLNGDNDADGALGLRYPSVGTTEDEHAVKTTPGVLYSIIATNTNADERYLRCANATAANTSPGTTTPILDLAIPGNASGAGISTSFPKGLTFTTALTCWLVTGAADTDVAEVAANEIKIQYTYR